MAVRARGAGGRAGAALEQAIEDRHLADLGFDVVDAEGSESQLAVIGDRDVLLAAEIPGSEFEKLAGKPHAFFQFEDGNAGVLGVGASAVIEEGKRYRGGD